MKDQRLLNMMSVTVDDQTRDWVAKEAKKQDRPKTWVIRVVLEQHIMGQKKTRGRPKKAV